MARGVISGLLLFCQKVPEFTPPAPKPINYTLLAVKTVIALLVITVAAWLLLRFIFKASKKTLKGEALVGVHLNVPILPGKYISLVEVLGKFFLLGITDESITLLSEVNDREWLNRILEALSKELPPTTFGEYFSKWLSKIGLKSSGRQNILKLLERHRKKIEDLEE